MGGGLAAALAGRGGGKGGGGLLAAIAGRGRGRGGGGGGLDLGAGRGALGKKKPKTLASAAAALEKATKRAAADADRLPVKLPEFAVVAEATGGALTSLKPPEDSSDDETTKTAAAGEWWWDRWDREEREKVAAHASSARRRDRRRARADAADAAAKDAADRLREATSAARDAGDATRRELRDVEGALDVWRARERDAPNRAAALVAEERAWAARERAENTAALALTRTLVPPGVAADTADGLRVRAARVVAAAAAAAKRRKAGDKPSGKDGDDATSDKKALAVAAAWGGCYTYALADRLRASKPLHWVQAHPDDLATANFLAGAGAEAFKNLGDYDVVELRAIYASCPEKFQLDASGAKAQWRANLVERLQQLVARDRGDEVPAGWDGLNNRRRRQRLPPLPDKLRRHPAYHYPSAEQLDATAEKHAQLRQRRDDRKRTVAELEAKLEELRGERDAAFAVRAVRFVVPSRCRFFVRSVELFLNILSKC